MQICAATRSAPNSWNILHGLQVLEKCNRQRRAGKWLVGRTIMMLSLKRPEKYLSFNHLQHLHIFLRKYRHTHNPYYHRRLRQIRACHANARGYSSVQYLPCSHLYCYQNRHRSDRRQQCRVLRPMQISSLRHRHQLCSQKRHLNCTTTFTKNCYAKFRAHPRKRRTLYMVRYYICA